MDPIRDWLFDAPWWLLIAIAVTAVALVLYALPRRDRKLLGVGVAVLVLTGIWTVLSVTMLTPQEQAIDRVDKLVAAFEAQEWDTFDRLLDSETRFFNRLKGQEITDAARDASENFRVDNLVILSRDVRRDDLGVVIDIRLLGEHNLNFARTSTTAWRFDFRERAGTLQLEHIDPLATERIDLPEVLEGLDFQKSIPFN